MGKSATIMGRDGQIAERRTQQIACRNQYEPQRNASGMSQIDSRARGPTERDCASRPVSRVLYGPRGCPQGRGGHSSGTSVAGCLARPTRTTGPETGWRCCPAASSLFGLAPDGVYRAAAVAGARGGLLPHRFTLAAACRGGFFSVALSLRSRDTPSGRTLSGIVFPWSPDFPPTPPFGDRVSGHPAGWHVSLKDGDDPRQANLPRRNFGAIASMVNHRLARLR